MPSQEQLAICQMFDRIAPTYDPINHLLSFGQDLRWRRFVASQIRGSHGLKILDIATGTADLLLAICKAHPRFELAVGIDLSETMLAVGQKKLKKPRLKIASSSRWEMRRNYHTKTMFLMW